MLSALEEYFDSVIEEGIEKGREEGKVEGKKEGEKEGKKAIVLRMLKNKMDEKTIKLVTEITQKELNEIKNKI